MTTNSLPKKRAKSSPTWSGVKIRLKDFDRAGLLDLVSDLYSANKDVRRFLHARFAAEADPLEVYRKLIDEAIYPDVYRSAHPKISVSAAKKAISEYYKATRRIEGEAELRVYFCETAAAFVMEYGYDDEGYLDALVGQFESSLMLLPKLDPERRIDLLHRLVDVRDICNCGYGVQDAMDDLLAKAEAPDYH